jgi:hypothetical protein
MYILNEDQTCLTKMKLTLKKIETVLTKETEIETEFKGNVGEHINYSEGEKISIRTYKEGINAFDTMSYEVSLIYKNSLKKFNWNLIEENKFCLNNNNVTFPIDEKIVNVFPHINKGVKSINLILRKNIFILDEDLSLKSNFTKVDNLFTNFQLFQNFMSYSTKKEIYISYTENINIPVLICDLKIFTKFADINNFIFDPYTHLIYALINDGELLVITPRIYGLATRDQDNHCSIQNILKLPVSISGKLSMEIIKKSLVIANNLEDELYVIDLNEINIENNSDGGGSGGTNNNNNNSVEFNKINLSDYHTHSKNEIENLPRKTSTSTCINKLTFLKNHGGANILIRKDDYTILLFDIIDPTSKLKGGEDFSFNFKIPIIFIALIILFFYHYFKNKSNSSEKKTPDDEYTNEIYQKLREYGAFENVK